MRDKRGTTYKTYEGTHREWIRIKAKKRLEERARSVDLWVLAIVSFILGCVAVLMLSGCAPAEAVETSPPSTATAKATATSKAAKVPELTAEEIIPRDYYDSLCYIPKGVSLNSYLTEYEWGDPYEEHGWDCSQMSAYVEWLVENCGYEANIVIANRIDHAWVEIKIGNKWRPYEATTGSFYFWPEILSEIYAGNTLTFKDIYEVIDYSTRRFSSGSPSWIYMAINEWAWWEE